MPKPNRVRQAFCASVPITLLFALEKFRAKQAPPPSRSAVVEAALFEYLKKQEKKNEHCLPPKPTG